MGEKTSSAPPRKGLVQGGCRELRTVELVETICTAVTAQRAYAVIWSLGSHDGGFEGGGLDVELLAVVDAEPQDADDRVGAGRLRADFDSEDDAAVLHRAADDFSGDLDPIVGGREIHDSVPVRLRDPVSVSGGDRCHDHSRLADLHGRALDTDGERGVAIRRAARRAGQSDSDQADDRGDELARHHAPSAKSRRAVTVTVTGPPEAIASTARPRTPRPPRLVARPSASQRARRADP